MHNVYIYIYIHDYIILYYSTLYHAMVVDISAWPDLRHADVVHGGGVHLDVEPELDGVLGELVVLCVTVFLWTRNTS